MEMVQGWIDEEPKTPPQEGLAALEMSKRAHLEFCHWCGRDLGYNVPIIRWGGRNYHRECYTKMLSQ